MTAQTKFFIGAVPKSVIELAARERPLWPALSAMIPASHPRNEEAVDPAVAGAGGDERQPLRFRTVEEYEARQTSIRDELTSLDSEWVGQIMPEEQTRRWNALNEELEENGRIIAHIQTRSERLSQLQNQPAAIEGGATFNVSRPQRGPSDIHDVWAIRQHARGPDDEIAMLRENAMRAVEGAHFAHPSVDDDDAKARIAKLMARFQQIDESSPMGAQHESNVAEFARRMLITGAPAYQRAFGKQIMGRYLSPEEARALSTGTTAGGFAVPFTLDPTIIPTSNLSVNPYRALARIETIATTTWQGVSSAGVTATRRGEGAQTSDAAPSLVQPTGTPTRVDAFVPYSIEIDQDWGSLQSEMAMLIQDAKDDEEASAFSTGNGVAPNPQGILSGATTLVTGAGTGTFAVADVYAVYNNLGSRFKPRAQWAANESVYNLIRQFDTAGGASIFIENLQLPTGGMGVPTPGNLNARLLGRGANEASGLPSFSSTSGTKLMVFGDWRYFIIVDRIGMNVELIPHLFGTSQLPTGQRGLFAFWRNTSIVVSANAFRVLVVR